MRPSQESPNVTIRRVRARDVPRLAASLAPDLTAERVEHRWQEYRDGYREMLVAELDGDVVGTVGTTGQLQQMPGSLRLFALDVGPAYRGRGVGTALMEAVEEIARQRGLAQVNLEVGVKNHDAIRLYERRGYQRQGDAEVVLDDLSWVMVKPV